MGHTQLDLFENGHFYGSDYVPVFDDERLRGNIRKVWECMADGSFRTLDEITKKTGVPQASVSANLRHLRRDEYGSHVIEKRSRGDRVHGLWEYRLIPSK